MHTTHVSYYSVFLPSPNQLYPDGPSPFPYHLPLNSLHANTPHLSFSTSLTFFLSLLYLHLLRSLSLISLVQSSGHTYTLYSTPFILVPLILPIYTYTLFSSAVIMLYLVFNYTLTPGHLICIDTLFYVPLACTSSSLLCY